MPLTEFQRTVLRVIANNRTPESHFAGGTAINRQPINSRFSHDLDIFNDAAEMVLSAFVQDKKSLLAAGFDFRDDRVFKTFCRAIVSRDNNALEIEWCYASAFRFFPVIPDPDFGWRLNDFDLAVNKAIAMADRDAARDILDLILLEENGFPLGMLVWAACGKDPGLSPGITLTQMRANSRTPNPEEILENGVSRTPEEVKSKWLQMSRRCQAELSLAIDAKLVAGNVYLDKQGTPAWGDKLFTAPQDYMPHAARCGGVLPEIR